MTESRYEIFIQADNTVKIVRVVGFATGDVLSTNDLNEVGDARFHRMQQLVDDANLGMKTRLEREKECSLTQNPLSMWLMKLAETAVGPVIMDVDQKTGNVQLIGIKKSAEGEVAFKRMASSMMFVEYETFMPESQAESRLEREALRIKGVESITPAGTFYRSIPRDVLGFRGFNRRFK